MELAILGLPSGVSSRTATALTVTAGTHPAHSTDFRLDASQSAPLATFTATIRGTSGSIRHTVELPVTVVDQLPSCA